MLLLYEVKSNSLYADMKLSVLLMYGLVKLFCYSSLAFAGIKLVSISPNEYSRLVSICLIAGSGLLFVCVAS